MSESIAFPLPAGPTYTIPDVGDENWGQNVTNFLVAIPAGVMPTAGTFTLTGDVSFGASFGILSKYLKSVSSNIAATGVVRLSNTDTVVWRNFLNSADLALGVDSANNLTFNGSTMSFSGAVNPGLANQLAYYPASTNAVSGLTSITALRVLQSNASGLPVAGNAITALRIVQSDVNGFLTANAAITASRLVQSDTNGFLVANAAITPLRLLQSDASGFPIDLPAITASRLLQSDTNGLPIALPAITALRALESDASGFPVASSTTSTELGYVSGVTSSIQTQINTKAPSNSPTFTGTVTVPNGVNPTDAAAYGQLQVFQPVIQVTSTTPTTTSSSSFQSTALTTSITPVSSSHRVRITVTGMMTPQSAGTTGQFSIFRGATDLSNGQGFGSARGSTATNNPRYPASATYIDSPSSTSPVTYIVKVLSTTGADPVTFGELGTQVLTLEEIA